MGEQTKALGLAASLKLKTASTLLAVHRKPTTGGRRGHVPDPSKLSGWSGGLGAALKGT